MESQFACFKAGLAPVNTNYRYIDDELVYLWSNADAVAVVFHGAFTERIEGLRDRVPTVHTWLWVDDGSGPCPAWATAYEDAANAVTDGPVSGPWGRDGDDLVLMYTGGTTGMPKGVMWRQDSLIKAVSSSQNPRLLDVDADYEALAGDIAAPGVSLIPACPEMHGTGQFTAQLALCGGGSNVLLPGRHFDVAELLDTIESKKVQAVTIVGDAFAKPILAALDAEPDRWDISSVFLMTSSGVMWSQESKTGLLRHNATMMLIDAFSSSEAIGLGQSVSTAQGSSGTAKFMLGDNSRVITDDGADVEPGSGQIGRVAVRGFTPIGYYKDEAKTAATFVRIGDDTYSIPGDYAMVEADGSLTLLGRGSVVINTAGEKVFPEEVEEACKLHPAVADAVAVGIPDDRFGEAVTAVVELHSDTTLEPDELVAHVKERLAAFKAPRNVVVIDTIGRAANGKVDYKRLKGFAADQLGVTLPS